MKHILISLAVMAVVSPVFAAANTARTGHWSGPSPEHLPQVTTRWQSVNRNLFIVQGVDYQIKIRMKPVAIVAIKIGDKQLLSAPIVPGFVDKRGVHYRPQQSGVPHWKTWQGQSYKPARSVAARENVWDAGPYYWDAHILDIPLVPANARSDHGPVVRGQIVFHTFADHVNIEFRVDPEKTGIVPARAIWRLQAHGLTQTNLGKRKLIQLGGQSGGACLLGPAGQTYDTKHAAIDAPLVDAGGDSATHHCWWVLRPAVKGESCEQLFHGELDPLPASHFTVTQGRYLGYHAAAGLYEFETLAAPIKFGSAYDNPNRRMQINVAVTGDGTARQLICKSFSHAGILPATVLADDHGFMLPTVVQTSKNFHGEREEPDDTGYGHAYFPLTLAPHADKRFEILHLFQRWGSHMVKQVSSIRFFHIYWHLSTGVSETTCFTIPWMKVGGSYVRIPDYRSYSGPFWKGQPQHDCLSLPGLLQYKTGANNWVRLVYDKTVFDSVAPNLSRFKMYFTTSDGAAHVTATAMEVPQRDQNRTFLKLRYVWDKDVHITGNAQSNFRWLNVMERRRPKTVLLLKAGGHAVDQPLPSGNQQIQPQALDQHFPFAGTSGLPGMHGAPSFSSFVLIRSIKAKLGGHEADVPYFSGAYRGRGGNYWFTGPDQHLTIKKGDFIEADVMLVPLAEGTQPLVVPERERGYYGVNPPVAAVQIGHKLRDFPAVVRADHEVAQVSLKGGATTTSLTVTGFDGWKVPLLWENGVWQNQQAYGGDGYQVNNDGDGKYRFTFDIPQRGGAERDVMVTRAQCSTGIDRVTDLSGFVKLTTAADQGTFSLKAPALFAPGENRIDRATSVVTFKGTAKAVRQVPLTIEPGEANVTATISVCNPQSMKLKVKGTAKLTFSELTPNTAYQVSVDGQKQIMRTGKDVRELSVQVGQGAHSVALDFQHQ